MESIGKIKVESEQDTTPTHAQQGIDNPFATYSMTTPESQEFRDTFASDLLNTPKGEDRQTMLEIAKEDEECQRARKEKLDERQTKREAGTPQTPAA